MPIENCEIQGLDSIQQMFAELPDKFQKKAIKPAMRDGAQLIKRRAVQNLSIGLPYPKPRSGLLREYIRIVSLRDRPGYPVMVLIGLPKKNLDKTIDKKMRQHPGWKYHWEPFYWRFMEFGFHTGKGRNRRFVPARPWLRPAILSVQDQIVVLMANYKGEFFKAYQRGAA